MVCAMASWLPSCLLLSWEEWETHGCRLAPTSQGRDGYMAALLDEIWDFVCITNPMQDNNMLSLQEKKPKEVAKSPFRLVLTGVLYERHRRWSFHSVCCWSDLSWSIVHTFEHQPIRKMQTNWNESRREQQEWLDVLKMWSEKDWKNWVCSAQKWEN